MNMPRPGFRSRFVPVALSLLAAAGWRAEAQIPGSELPNGSRARSEYLEATYTDVKAVLAEWHDHLRGGDVKKLTRLFTADGLYAPIEGYYVQGRDAVADSLTSRLSRIRGYHASLLDFTASGGLAYYLGRMGYRLDGPGEAGRDVSGTFVMVLYQEGRRWRVRSYLERPAAD
ncbi:MAG: nuclear transport factor 2 family protein [Gemmatimonadetes bacterium]|nr:nuclear transport factor 2 family protein [Gemmatimonadota bacterium]